MARSAFVNAGGQRQSASGGGSGPFMTFTAMLVRPAPASTGFPVPKNDAFMACGLLVWDGTTYEAAAPVVKGQPLARSGAYRLGGSAQAPGPAGQGGAQPDFSIPMQLDVQLGGYGPLQPPPSYLQQNPFLRAALEAQLGVRRLHLHGPVQGQPLPGLGLLGADAAAFWQRWQATQPAARPTRLRITYTRAGSAGGGNAG